MKNKLTNNELQEELRLIAPGLSELNREDGFIVPHNYFRELPDRVWVRIQEERAAPETLWTHLQKMFWPQKGRLYPALAFASVLMLIIAGILYIKPQTSQDLFVSISQDEALEYVLDNLEDFSSEDLAEAGMMADWDAVELTPVSGDELDQMMNEMVRDEGLMNELMN